MSAKAQDLRAAISDIAALLRPDLSPSAQTLRVEQLFDSATERMGIESKHVDPTATRTRGARG